MGKSTKQLSPWQWLSHFIPLLRWAPVYDWRTNLVGDVIAALTVTAVAAPEAVSYAGIAGLPPAQGLNTGFLAPLAYAVAGASPQLIVGPTAIMCILTGNAIPTSWGGLPVGNGAILSGPPEVLRVKLAALLALFVAAIQAGIGLLRLGGVVALVSTPVVAGFTTGSALLTASSQFATLLGLPKCKGSSGGSCTFAEAVQQVVESSSSVRGPVVAMSCVCIAVLLLVKYGPPAFAEARRAKRARDDVAGGAATSDGGGVHSGWKLASNLAPLVLVAVTVPIVASDAPELERWGLTPPKTIPQGVPAPLLPFGEGSGLEGGSRADYIALLTAAFPLAIIGYMGAVTITKTVARQDGPYPTDAAQEIWGQVACNAACAVGQGLPVTGSFSRTAVNSAGGARTALASALTGLLMALALQTLTGVLSLVPDVARSAIVVVAISKMVELSLLPRLWRADKRDFLSFLATVLIVILKDAATGLLCGVLIQWFLALTRSHGAPSRMTVHAWTHAALAGTGGGGGGRGAGAASTAPAAASLVKEVDAEGVVEHHTASRGAGSCWTDVSEEYLPGADSAPATSATSPRPVAVSLAFGPDLQFGASERLRCHIEEAVALFTPPPPPAEGEEGGEEEDTPRSGARIAVLLLDLSTCVSADSTGAGALLNAVRDVASGAAGVAVVSHSASPSVEGIIRAVAADLGQASPASVPGVHPHRTAGAFAGSLLLLSSAGEAEAVAMVLLARAARGLPVSPQPGKGGAGLAGASSASSAAAPLLTGEGEYSTLADRGADGAADSPRASKQPVQGVPLSPVLVRRQAARRRRAIAPAQDGAGRDGGRGVGSSKAVVEESAARAGFASVVASVLRSVASGFAEAAAVLDDGQPLFTVRA